MRNLITLMMLFVMALPSQVAQASVNCDDNKTAYQLEACEVDIGFDQNSIELIALIPCIDSAGESANKELIAIASCRKKEKITNGLVWLKKAGVERQQNRVNLQLNKTKVENGLHCSNRTRDHN